MRCGSRCFSVTFEVDGDQQFKSVTARSSVDARKMIRQAYGESARIVSVKEEKKT
ncbi:hypothetical protein FHS18_003546 [Paenibacillus phyllosphaerae]|uniref:Uncharacterized protein n=1 Tax=Paenibacillus phyllosphaerae TaxID=274593 RepID=A0A7W5FNR9_9BACL|nr:hypothetical protein [Paenibacillus phyllosphaerae]MBB3111478.1 hypothetical protein [Paenibacillus phyllosphaerae]